MTIAVHKNKISFNESFNKSNFEPKNIFDLVMSMVQIQMYILTNPCCFANFETWHKYMLDLDHISIIQIIIDIEEHQPLCKM